MNINNTNGHVERESFLDVIDYYQGDRRAITNSKILPIKFTFQWHTLLRSLVPIIRFNYNNISSPIFFVIHLIYRTNRRTDSLTVYNINK